MTAEEKATLEWLRYLAHGDPRHMANKALAMLAQPRLPEEPDRSFIRATFKDWPLVIEEIEKYHRDLYAHLTKPKTKTVEVWHVEAAVLCAEGWVPGCHAYRSRAEAEKRVPELIAGGWHAVRVTGPHTQEVPA